MTPFNVDAIRTLNKAYMAEIRSLAREYNRQPEDNRDDWLHETIDGHEFVIYTWKARAVMVCTDSPDAWQDVLEDRPDKVEGEAYWAMRQDVTDMAYALARHP